MMPAALLEDLEQRGIAVSVDGDELKFKAPKDALSPELRETIRANKTAILEFIKGRTIGTSKCAQAEVDAAPVHREYRYLDGRVLRLTKEEFQNLVEVFGVLLLWSQGDS